MTHDLPIPADSSGLHAAPETARSRAVDFYELTKPRMNFLVLLTTAVGYYMAVRNEFGWLRFFNVLAGTGLLAAASAILNQVIERGPDALMPRTKDRPLPAGRITPREATVLGLVLLAAGTLWLAAAVNWLTTALGLLTVFTYIGVYTPLKRISTLNTVAGAIPGALPPMMGWCAVHGKFSLDALALFGILFVWQLPHFLAIAILYKNDYAAGGFKMLPVIDKDLAATSRQIFIYSLALIPTALIPVWLHMSGAFYFGIATLLGLMFLTFSISCVVSHERRDARKLFFASIIYLPLLLAVLVIDKL